MSADEIPAGLDPAQTIRTLAERNLELTAAAGTFALERDEALHALADCVAKATDYGEQDGGFVAAYLLPTGPIHRAIPLLERYGITVRPGFDGRLNNRGGHP